MWQYFGICMTLLKVYVWQCLGAVQPHEQLHVTVDLIADVI